MTEALAERPAADDADALAAGLTPTELHILEFEKQWWRYAGAKESAIRELFGMTATRYYQALNALLDNPAALAVEPMLVKRLRRMRQERHRERSARRLSTESGH